MINKLLRTHLAFLTCLLLFNSLAVAQMHPQFTKRFNIHQPKFYNLFVKGNIDKIKSEVKKLGGHFKYAAGDIASITIPTEKYDEFMHADWYESQQISYYTGHTMEDKSNTNNNVNLVQSGAAPLTQSYDGTGIIVGFIDSGLDFNHPDFKLANGHSRIKYLWDQADTAGTIHTMPYGYGKDWDSAQINAGSCTHSPPLNYYGHGTLTTGVACGNSQQQSNYRAVAPNADIIFVAADLNGLTGNSFETCVIDAANYIFTKANALGKPCVINASLGTYAGSHDGTDLVTQAIENMLGAQNGRSFVNAAGNAGGIYLHLGYTIPTADSAYTFFNTFPTNGLTVMYFELFSDYADWNNAQFAVGCDYNNPYNHLPRTPWMQVLTDYQMASQTTFTRYDTIKNLAGQRLGIMESYCEKQNGHYFMYFGVIADSTTHYVWRFMTKGSGKLDVWSHPNYTGSSYLIRSGLPTTAQLPDISKYMYSDTEQTIVGEWNCSAKVISVANYLNRNSYPTWQGTTYTCDAHTPGTIYFSSSKGPTRTGAQKPDIAASGEWTMAANDLYWLNWAKTGNPNGIYVDTLHGPHKGTSAAAPAVAGVVALYLQKYPTASWADIKASVTTCVKTDAYTGYNLPNYNWGYGKLDAFKVLNCKGCTNSTAPNYNYLSQIDDGSCINNSPVAFFKHHYGTICTGDTIQLFDSSTNNPTQYYWSFGGGALPSTSTAVNPILTFLTGGKHIVQLLVQNASGNSAYTDTLFVTVRPENTFSLVGSICATYNDNIVYIGNASATANYTWTFNGGNVTGNGQGPYLVNWTTPGSKIVSLQVSENGCTSAIAAQTVTVQNIPTINFTYHVVGGQVVFINNTSNANSYSWAFGDGGSSNQNNPTHQYFSNGNYIVTLTAQNGWCVASDSEHIAISGITGIENINQPEKEMLVKNLTNNELQVVLKNFRQPTHAELRNALGQIVLTTAECKDNSFTFNTTNLPAAIYFISCFDKDGSPISRQWVKANK